MNLSVTAKRLEPVDSQDHFSTVLSTGLVGDGIAGALSLVGSRSERLRFLADWVDSEVAAADLDDLDTIRALKSIADAVIARAEALQA